MQVKGLLVATFGLEMGGGVAVAVGGNVPTKDGVEAEVKGVVERVGGVVEVAREPEVASAVVVVPSEIVVKVNGRVEVVKLL
jgi:hypothetical protein